jgi:hypothetical protein
LRQRGGGDVLQHEGYFIFRGIVPGLLPAIALELPSITRRAADPSPRPTPATGSRRCRSTASTSVPHLDGATNAATDDDMRIDGSMIYSAACGNRQIGQGRGVSIDAASSSSASRKVGAPLLKLTVSVDGRVTSARRRRRCSASWADRALCDRAWDLGR